MKRLRRGKSSSQTVGRRKPKHWRQERSYAAPHRQRATGARKQQWRNSFRYTDSERDDFLILTKRFSYALKFDAKLEKKAKGITQAYEGREEEFLAGREDLRDNLIFTVDGETARDYDDAISLRVERVRKHPVYILGVHIADVSYFVEPDSLLDREACARGTSVYVPGHVLPMFPEALSNGICSLKEGAVRLTVSGEFVLDHEGTVQQARFFRSVIKSRYRLTYPEVQGVLSEGASLDPALDEVLKQMEVLSKILLGKRLKAGALDLVTREQIFELSDERVEAVSLKSRLGSERIIEEFMLLMNREVAQFLEMRGLGIYRVHDAPEAEALHKLKTMLKKSKIDLSSVGVEDPLMDGGTDYNQLSQTLAALPSNELQETISQWILQAMKQAQYACECRGHYGLAFTHYTHFTSPIRRYPDLLAHRLLLNFSEDSPRRLFKKSDLHAMAQTSNTSERKAVDCEREYKKIKAIRYLSSQTELKPVLAAITGMHPRGHVYVRVKDTGIDGMIHSDYFRDEFKIKPVQQVIIARDGQKRYELGSELRVMVESLEPAYLRIYFKPLI